MSRKEVIKNYNNFKLKNTTSNLLKRYIKIFNRHYKSSIDLILTKRDSKEQINYNDIIFSLKEKSILRRFYTKEESDKRLINYTKYYTKYGDLTIKYYKNKKKNKIMFKNKKRKFRMIKGLKSNPEIFEEGNILSFNKFLGDLDKKTNFINQLKMEDSIEKIKQKWELSFENYFQINLLDLRFFKETHDIYNPKFSSDQSEKIENISLFKNNQFIDNSINLTDLSILTYLTDLECKELSNVVNREECYDNSFLLEDFFGKEIDDWSKNKKYANLKETDLNSNSGEKFNRRSLKSKINILENSTFIKINKRKTFNHQKNRESLNLTKNNYKTYKNHNIQSHLNTIKNLKKKKNKMKNNKNSICNTLLNQKNTIRISSLKNLSPKWKKKNKDKKLKMNFAKSSKFSLLNKNKNKIVKKIEKKHIKMNSSKLNKKKSNKIKSNQIKISKKKIIKTVIKKKIYNLKKKKLSKNEANKKSQPLLINFFNNNNKVRIKNQELGYNNKRDIDEYNYYHHRNVRSLTNIETHITNYKLDIENLFNDNDYN